MSRSYKKTPVCKDSPSKSSKRFANKKVRRTLDIPNGGSYKKCYESWDISDWACIWTKEDAIRDWNRKAASLNRQSRYETLEEYLQYWEKCAKRK